MRVLDHVNGRDSPSFQVEDTQRRAIGKEEATCPPRHVALYSFSALVVFPFPVIFHAALAKSRTASTNVINCRCGLRTFPVGYRRENVAANRISACRRTAAVCLRASKPRSVFQLTYIIRLLHRCEISNRNIIYSQTKYTASVCSRFVHPIINH